MQQSKNSGMFRTDLENVQDLIDISSFRLLKGFAEKDILDVFELGYQQEYYLNDLIISGKNESDFIYFVLDGIISLWKMGTPLVHLNKGDSFNESVVYFPDEGVYGVRAESMVHIYKIHRDSILTYFAARPEILFKRFTLNIMKIIHCRAAYYENRLITLNNKI